MKLEFKPEDFLFDGEDTDAGPRFLAHMACTFANKRLAEMLAEAPVMYGTYEYYDGAGQMWLKGVKGGSTHTAKLVQIEEIKK